MNITEYIKELEKIRDECGDISIVYKLNHWSFDNPEYKDYVNKPFSETMRGGQKVCVIHDIYGKEIGTD